MDNFLGEHSHKCGITGPMGHFVTFIYIIEHLPGIVPNTLYVLLIHYFIHFKRKNNNNICLGLPTWQPL